MANDINPVSLKDIKTKVAEIDGKQALVEELPDGSARMVVTNQPEESTDEE